MLLPPTITLFGTVLPTYTALWSAALLWLALWTVGRTPQTQRGAVADTLLGGLVGGLIAARAGYVLLYAPYFRHVPYEALDWTTGGLNWQGAVVGAVLGMGVIAQWRAVVLAPLLERLAWALPLLTLAGWWGCETALCAYGAEVARLSDYPSWLVWEALDGYGFLAPRFHTQFVGILLAGGMALGVLVPYPRQGHFWLQVCLLSGGMFGISFLRGDYAPVYGGVRLDAWLSVMVGIWAAALVWRTTKIE
jgi:prolipoprotein diacylglyceryltransferase